MDRIGRPATRGGPRRDAVRRPRGRCKDMIGTESLDEAVPSPSSPRPRAWRGQVAARPIAPSN